MLDHSAESTPFLPIQQVAKDLNVSEKTVRRWITRRELVAYKLGEQWRVDTKDLEIFLKLRRN